MTDHDIPTDTDTRTDRRAATSPAKRRSVAIGLAGGLLAGTAAGLVIGVPGLTTTTSTDAAEPGARLREALQALVDDGTITAEQADAVTAHLVENRPERGEGRRGHHRGPAMFGLGVASEAVADLLDIDAAELRSQLREGATLAEIATAEGVDPQAVVDELVGELRERVDNAVESGRIDQAGADEKLAEAEARLTDLVNNGRPDRRADQAD
jgi:hypothetical protein